MQFPQLEEVIVDRKELTARVQRSTRILEDIRLMDEIADRWEGERLLSQSDIEILRDLAQKAADRWRPRMNSSGLGDSLRKNSFRACEAMVKTFPEEGSF